MVRALQDQGSLRDLGFGAGNQLIGVFVKKSNSDLAELVSILHEVCGIDDPQVLLLGESFYLGKEVKVRFSSKPPSNQLPKLNRTDYRIVLAIHHDARKSYSDIAREVGISTKTAKRRLLNMIEANIIEFKVLKQPTSSMDVHFVINITLRSRADKGPFLDVLKKIYSDRIDRAAFFDSPPKAVVLDGIALTIDELNNIVDGLAKLPEVDVLVPNVILRNYYFDTQLEKMLLEMAA
jgi:DNA-binding Lrp family transcriptional regulator